MISPYEVKDRQHNQSYNDPFELKIDKGLTYSSGTDSCSVSFVFSEVSADKMKTLTKYIDNGYKVTMKPRFYNGETNVFFKYFLKKTIFMSPTQFEWCSVYAGCDKRTLKDIKKAIDLLNKYHFFCIL